MNITKLIELAEAIKNGVPDERDLALWEVGGSLPSILAYISATEKLVEEVRALDAKIGFPSMYEPREMDAFKNGWNSNDEKWSRQRDNALATFTQETKDLT